MTMWRRRLPWPGPAAALATALVAILPVAAETSAVPEDGAGPDWRGAHPGYTWSFPRDHEAHPGYRNEWWYFTGHLEAEDGRRFGYQFTFFRVGLLPAAPDLASAWAAPGLIMGHAALMDLAGGRHWFSEVLHREMPLLSGTGRAPEPLVWSLAPAGTPGRWELHWTGEGFSLTFSDRRQGLALSLELDPSKPLVLHGDGGYSRKGDTPGAASLYYSYTRMRTSGRLTTPGGSWTVMGESWMDKEFGSNQLEEGQVGWDWFSLQLDDGRDIMLYLLRDGGGRVDHRSGTVVDASGAARDLSHAGWSVGATGTWRSPATGARYPSRWTVSLPGEGLELEVVPLLAGQENHSRLAGGLFYWEGAVEVRDAQGRPAGRGFVELTGYGEDNRPPL